MVFIMICQKCVFHDWLPSLMESWDNVSCLETSLDVFLSLSWLRLCTLLGHLQRELLLNMRSVRVDCLFTHIQNELITICCVGWWCTCQVDPNSSPSRELEETTRASPYHVAEHHPMRPDSLQPYTERSSQPGSELPSVEAVYVWHYALLVVHARKEEEEMWVDASHV